MSALDEIKAKQKIERTALEWAVLICDETGGEATAMDAATQLSDLTTKLDLSQKENCNLRLEIQAVEANYDALQTPMPCGHLARYAVNGEDGTQYCCMCDRNALMDEGQKALKAIEERNKLFEKACLFLAYAGYGVNAEKFTDLPDDIKKFVLGMFDLEIQP